MALLSTRIRSLATFSLAIVYLCNLYFKSSVIKDLDLILLVIVISLSFTVVTGSAKVIGYVSFALSISLLLIYHAPLSVWTQALQENLYLVVMFTLVPLLGIPIQYGGYFESLQSVFRRYVHTNSRFYLLVSLISAFIGVLVNMAVVPLVHQISLASDKSSDKKLLSIAISRGFTTCTIWAPTTAAIALIIQLSDAEWHSFFPFGLFFGMIAGLIGYTMMKLAGGSVENSSAIAVATVDPAEKLNSIAEINLRKVIELSVFGITLIFLIVIVSLITGISTIIVVSIASLVFPVIWLALIGRLPVLIREFKGDYYIERLPRLKNEIVLFVGAGLFATSISYSHLGNYVPNILNPIVGSNPLWLAVVIILSSLILSVLGVHPIITVTILGGTLKAAAYGVTPTYMALILAISWAMGISIAPSSATVIAISGLTEQSPLKVGFGWNGLYVLIVSTVLIMLLTLFRAVGLV
ncbi:MAG: C4-dicarboxylate ABC transporter [Desulfosporosinus sp. BRH_c37]|nr:MAG: C4-dicarboxylate ABC transporter [Desulfosporosinus sp. BRH_c37]